MSRKPWLFARHLRLLWSADESEGTLRRRLAAAHAQRRAARAYRLAGNGVERHTLKRIVLPLAPWRLIQLRIRVLAPLALLTLTLLALLALLAENRNELPFVVFLTGVIDLDGLFITVGSNPDDPTGGHRSAGARSRQAATDPGDQPAIG